ncbi:MAG TPA: hypothetical protein VE010_23295 [Thermoanaerobaculia bacterium]|nr:hypothetical protein [Thermoanaerobaculia bacterium]
MRRFRFFNKQPTEPAMVIASLNARLQPVHRGEFFEDPLEEVLERRNLGEITGGGTMQMKTGEIEFCDVEVAVNTAVPDWERVLINALESLGAPRGSRLIVVGTGREIPFGVTEGLAVYLNGTDLPDEIYRECDSNHVYSEFNRLVGGEGRVLSWWEGPTETALYLYGGSFVSMRARIDEFIRTYPLCHRCRIEQIA